MPETEALREFRRSLQAAEQLRRIDVKGYTDPPPSKHQRAVQGLRGGAAVMMVAAFEEYLRASHEEAMTRLTRGRRQLDFGRLPDALRVHSVFTTLETAMKGPRHKKTDRLDRLLDIEQAARVVVSRTVNPAAFGQSGGNPSQDAVKEAFKATGVNDVFGQVKSDFDARWSAATHQTFIQEKLDEIVNRRHRVAHTADALNISRKDLAEAIRFLRVLGLVLDSLLMRQVEFCRRNALV